MTDGGTAMTAGGTAMIACSAAGCRCVTATAAARSAAKSAAATESATTAGPASATTTSAMCQGGGDLQRLMVKQHEWGHGQGRPSEERKDELVWETYSHHDGHSCWTWNSAGSQPLTSCDNNGRNRAGIQHVIENAARIADFSSWFRFSQTDRTTRRLAPSGSRTDPIWLSEAPVRCRSR